MIWALLGISGLGGTKINIPTNTSSLTPDCAKTIQQIFTSVTKERYVSGRFFAEIKSFVTREEAESLIYSPEMNGTSFVKHEGQMRSSKERIIYEGRWNFTQVCDLEHRPEVNTTIFIQLKLNHH
jgi:hypothetical protein